MSFHWLKDNVLCYMFKGEKLFDVPVLDKPQIDNLLSNEDISPLDCIDSFNLIPDKKLFISLRINGDEYQWEISNIYKETILITRDRLMCEILKESIEGAIRMYLSDRDRSIRFNILDVDDDNNYISKRSNPILEGTSHTVIEIFNSTSCVSMYIRLIKGIVKYVNIYTGDVNQNRTKIRRNIVLTSNEEEVYGLN